MHSYYQCDLILFRIKESLHCVYQWSLPIIQIRRLHSQYQVLLTLTRRRLARSVETPLAETHLQETIVKTIIVFMKIILFTQPDALPLRE